MCGLTKLGTNVVIMATVKERNNLCIIYDTSILAFTFKVTHWITWYILTVISFYDHTCDHARVTSKISFRVHYTLDNSVHTNCDFLNNHTCDLARVTLKISLAYIFKVTH